MQFLFVFRLKIVSIGYRERCQGSLSSCSGQTSGIPWPFRREGRGIERKQQFDAPPNSTCMKSVESLQGTGTDTVQTMCLVIHAFLRRVLIKGRSRRIVWLNRVMTRLGEKNRGILLPLVVREISNKLPSSSFKQLNNSPCYKIVPYNNIG